MQKTVLAGLAVVLAGAVVYFVTSDVRVDEVPSVVHSNKRKEPSADVILTEHPKETIEYLSDTPSATYLGGLENLSCLVGMKLRLKARFSYETGSSGARIVYYRDGSRLDGEVFDCDGTGYYKVSAKLFENGNVLAASPEFDVTVEGLPAELEGLQESDHVHF